MGIYEIPRSLKKKNLFSFFIELDNIGKQVN